MHPPPGRKNYRSPKGCFWTTKIQSCSSR